MSYHKIRDIKIEPNVVRDFYLIHEAAVDFAMDLVSSRKVIGLDWHIWNTGAAPISVTVDGGIAMTIPAGADRGFDNVKYAMINVTATVTYTIALTGVSM